MCSMDTITEHPVQGVVLVGHGGVPTNCPPHLVRRLKQLESQRRASGSVITQEEQTLNHQIRQWPRTPATDPYQAGLEALGQQLKPLLKIPLFALAYNEFCAPTLEEAVANLVTQGATDLTVISSMITPGGSHSEIEIPETLDQLRLRHPDIVIRYAWPFELSEVARLLASQVRHAQQRTTESSS